jgi:vesicular inhibitory amino acid transporter
VLLFLAGVALYTGLRLIQCLRLNPGVTRTYADLGLAAFGPVGRTIVDIQAHVMLCGAATVYLVLSGENIHTLFPGIPTRAGVALATAVVWFHVFLKTLKEVGALSVFNALVAVLIFVVVISQALTHRPEGPVVTHPIVWDISLGTSFAAFSFSYCVHPILPSVYESMAKPQQFDMMLALTFLGVLIIYIPISAVGYAVYGEDVKNVIYNNLPKGPAVTVVIVAVTVHVLCSYAIVISPTEQAIERRFRSEERSVVVLIFLFFVFFCFLFIFVFSHSLVSVQPTVSGQTFLLLLTHHRCPL